MGILGVILALFLSKVTDVAMRRLLPPNPQSWISMEMPAWETTKHRVRKSRGIFPGFSVPIRSERRTAYSDRGMLKSPLMGTVPVQPLLHSTVALNVPTTNPPSMLVTLICPLVLR
jgi:hypothetical protein